MENQRPLILISNDDGIIAKGISELIKFLRPLGEIVVMAPDAPRSGSACALTVTEPIHYQLVRKDVGLTVYKCSGTPTDCVKLAFHTVLDRKPDLVVGGINHGDNSSVNLHYSKELKGVKICEQTKGQWTNEWENFAHRGDAHYYWLTGEFENNDAENEKNDHWALDNGYVAITPTTVDATAYGLIDELKAWF